MQLTFQKEKQYLKNLTQEKIQTKILISNIKISKAQTIQTNRNQLSHS